jgi:8-oxo-dGTP pyrophosphatase MutT (NUDIX family)
MAMPHGPRVATLRVLYRIAYRLARLRAMVLPRRQRGVKCLLTHGDEVLLVRHTYGPRIWQLPGGTARRGEPPLAVAAREMQEELGLRGLAWRELVTLELALEGIPVSLTCAHAELDDPAVRPDPVEIEEARWFAMDELPARRGEEVELVLDLRFGRPV